MIFKKLFLSLCRLFADCIQSDNRPSSGFQNVFMAMISTPSLCGTWWEEWCNQHAINLWSHLSGNVRSGQQSMKGTFRDSGSLCLSGAKARAEVQFLDMYILATESEWYLQTVAGDWSESWHKPLLFVGRLRKKYLNSKHLWHCLHSALSPLAL